MMAFVVVERFCNTCHCHLETFPPQPVENLTEEWATSQFGERVSLYYRDLGFRKAVPIGWVLNKPVMEGCVIETWVSVLNPDTLKYMRIDR